MTSLTKTIVKIKTQIKNNITNKESPIIQNKLNLIKIVIVIIYRNNNINNPLMLKIIIIIVIININNNINNPFIIIVIINRTNKFNNPMIMLEIIICQERINKMLKDPKNIEILKLIVILKSFSN